MNRRLTWLVCALLGAAVLAVFATALQCGFVNYDDPAYVTQNRHVLRGLSWENVRWAFVAVHCANWHPLTWLSHALDCQLYGLRPWGHHLTSLLLHCASSALLFLLLNRMTGAMGCSAFVAALFALHPLRVESVVWVSERKDVLSAFFSMLTVLAYVRYTENLKSQISNFKLFYALSVLLFALGLMAKPMLVTLPFVLLLLDYWPLGRISLGARLLVEKIPFFVLAAGSSVVTFLAQNRTGAVASMARFPLQVRAANVPVAYARYVCKLLWPADLSAYYPYVAWRPAIVIGALLLLGAITALALWQRRARPYLAVGWFWFLGALVPTIGLVQAGGQSMADRYTYLPSIGFWIFAVWGLRDLTAARPLFRTVAGVGGALAVVAFSLLAWRQTGVYKNSGTLWEATLRGDPFCLAARNNLAKWLLDNGRLEAALAQCREAVAILPDDPTAHDNLARVFLRQGRLDDAVAESLKSIQAQPHSEVNRQTLGHAWLQKRQFARAAASFKDALAIDPSASEAWCNLGYALLQLGQIADAAAAYERALDLAPEYALAHNDLGNILLRQGRLGEAMEHFQRATELDPDFAEAHYNLAGVLARRGRLDEAIFHCQRAVEIQPALGAARDRLAELRAAKERNRGH